MGVSHRSSRWALVLVLACLAGPVLLGLGGALLPAFDYQPALGRHELSLAPWQALLAQPGLARSI